MSVRLVFIDTDISLGTPRAEIDDGAALLLLLRSPDIEVCAIGTVHGNAPLADVIHNARRLLSYAQSEHIPLGRGAARPLIEDPAMFADWRSSYGTTDPWPGNPDLPAAANLLIDLVHAHPNEITVLALGPLTNLALAARVDPGIVPLVREVIAMGGSVTGAGAEFNARCDPEAAAIVFDESWPLRLFGLDITRRVHFSRAEFTSLPDSDPAIALLKQQASGWIERVEGQGWDQGGCALHDAVAAAALIDDTLFKFDRASVQVELSEPTQRGVTRFTPHEQSHLQVAVEVDVGRCHDLIWKHLAG